MGSYVIRLKVLPADIATEHQKIVDSIASKLPSEAKIRGHRVEPIAFGLSAVIVDVVAPEEEGSIDKVEQAVSTAEFVGQCEVQGVSRMSSTLHTT
jgi:elongation factor 1-beta